MTDDERFGLLRNLMVVNFKTHKRDDRVPKDVPQLAGWTPGVPRLGIPDLLFTDASLGITNPGKGRVGPDGKPDTGDDIDLGLVSATWSLEEFTATYGDDDLKFVGEIDPWSGRFIPNIDGPNPERKGSRNNVGDVYAVATYTPPGADGKSPKPLRARAHLLVTVPLYMRFEPDWQSRRTQ